MTEVELKQNFLLGEDSVREFKREDVHNDSVAKVVVAFANFEGGEIWLGVEDDGSVSGITQSKIEERILQICRNNVSPPIIPKILFHLVEGKKVAQVSIPKGTAKPYKTQGRLYIRAGSLSVEPTNEELLRLFQESEQLHFETTSVYGSTIHDLDLLKFRIYCQDFRKAEVSDEETSQSLYNFEMTDEKGQCTVAGLLLFGKNIPAYLPQAGIQLALFKGLDNTGDILDSKTLAQPVEDCIRLSEQFVKFNSNTRSYFPKDTIYRKDVEDYPEFAVRELLANAFAHRDWTIYGQQIRLFMFDDRLEVFSPGKLPNTLNLQRALHGISYYRNPVIAQILRDYNLIEKFGRGLHKIVQYYRKNNLKAPEFEAAPHHFKVTLYKSNPNVA